MATNATQSKVDATRGYGAEVVQHGLIWDEANEKAKQLVQERGLTYMHPFDDLQLIAGQGTLGLEVYEDFPRSILRWCRLVAAGSSRECQWR